jgi:hypothetical protein
MSELSQNPQVAVPQRAISPCPFFGGRHGQLLGLAVVASVMGCVSCSIPVSIDSAKPEQTAVVWPPPKSAPTSSELPTDSEDADSKNMSTRFCDQTTVYADSHKTFVGGGDRRYGYVVCEGEVDLAFNIFTIQEAGEGFVENSFEVVSFTDSRTRVRIIESEGHRLIYEVDKMAYYVPGQLNVKSTATYAGTRISYAGQIYEIKQDGWYVDGRRVHSFRN